MEKINPIFIGYDRKRNRPRVGRSPNVRCYIPMSDSNGSSIRCLHEVFGNLIFLCRKTPNVLFIYKIGIKDSCQYSNTVKTKRVFIVGNPFGKHFS